MDTLLYQQHYTSVQIAAEKIRTRLGCALTENFYTRAMALELESIGCTCRIEDPIPVPYIIGDHTHFIGTLRADINVVFPDGTRALIELKHSQITAPTIRQAEQQICSYNRLSSLNERQSASILIVVAFPKNESAAGVLSILKEDGSQVEQLSF